MNSQLSISSFFNYINMIRDMLLMQKIIYTDFSWLSFDGHLFLSTIGKDINVALRKWRWNKVFFLLFHICFHVLSALYV